MSKANLAGHQADMQRPDAYIVGGFEEDGREVVKKTFKSGKPAEKPGFFMGGCDPTVPTGPKRKLRASWLADGPPAMDDKPPIPTPTRKWTPVGKKELPHRAQSHDGTTSASGFGVRKGKKPSPAGGKSESSIKLEPEKPSPAGGKSMGSIQVEKEEEEEPKEEEPAKEEEKPAEEKKEDPAKAKPAAPAPAAKIPVNPSFGGKIHVRKPPKPTEACVEEFHEMANSQRDHHADGKKEMGTVGADGKCSVCETKDDEIAHLKEELEKVKKEKGELAAQIKKIKGSARANKELKDEIFELKQELNKKDTADSNSKNFTKLENKLNTLKMIMDGRVDRNDLMEMQEHVDMLNMIINQDLKKNGMKNVWA